MSMYSNFNFKPYTFQEYPKWVGNVLCNTAADELALSPKEEPVQAAKEPERKVQNKK